MFLQCLIRFLSISIGQTMRYPPFPFAQSNFNEARWNMEPSKLVLEVVVKRLEAFWWSHSSFNWKSQLNQFIMQRCIFLGHLAEANRCIRNLLLLWSAASLLTAIVRRYLRVASYLCGHIIGWYITLFIWPAIYLSVTSDNIVIVRLLVWQLPRGTRSQYFAFRAHACTACVLKMSLNVPQSFLDKT